MAVETAAYNSAVVPGKYYGDNDDDHVKVFYTTESGGIFVVPHNISMRQNVESERKRKNSHGNMLKSLQTLFITVAATFALAATKCQVSASLFPVAQGAAITSTSSNSHVGYKECLSMDLRNHCDEFNGLENCTVVTGFLSLALMSNESCNYDNYRFPKLREITDFLVIYNIVNLKTFKTIFPNLTVIRGRRVFLNYAFGIFRMPNMTAVSSPF